MQILLLLRRQRRVSLRLLWLLQLLLPPPPASPLRYSALRLPVPLKLLPPLLLLLMLKKPLLGIPYPAKPIWLIYCCIPP